MNPLSLRDLFFEGAASIQCQRDLGCVTQHSTCCNIHEKKMDYRMARGDRKRDPSASCITSR